MDLLWLLVGGDSDAHTGLLKIYCLLELDTIIKKSDVRVKITSWMDVETELTYNKKFKELLEKGTKFITKDFGCYDNSGYHPSDELENMVKDFVFQEATL